MRRKEIRSPHGSGMRKAVSHHAHRTLCQGKVSKTSDYLVIVGWVGRIKTYMTRMTGETLPMIFAFELTV